MAKINIPYGKKFINFSINDQYIEDILVSSNNYSTHKTQEELVKSALDKPIETRKLDQLSKEKSDIVIISSDHTRPVPSQITIPILLQEIRKANKSAKVTILVATGLHRASTQKELKEKYGEEINEKVEIKIHSSRDNNQMAKIGRLPSGGDLILNRKAVEADLLIAEGFIEPHFFAGFTGGRKSILPGVASEKTVLANHCSEFIAHKSAKAGKLKDNPLHEDMIYAAKQIGLDFILNVVLNKEQKIIKAFAGHRERAHIQGTEFVKELAGVKAKKSDVVITTNGGYPLDQNIYQSVKGMTTAEQCCKKDGVIIMVAECRDGHGGKEFYETFKNSDNPKTIREKILIRNRNETISDQWESQVLARILTKHVVIMVTDVDSEIIEDMGMYWAKNIDSAINKAKTILGKDKPKINIIPDGTSIIIKN